MTAIRCSTLDGPFNIEAYVAISAGTCHSCDKDMDSLDLDQGQEVVIQSHMEDGRKRKVSGFHAVRYSIPQGCAASYFPETNELIAVEYFADRSFTPISKLVPVTVSKSTE